MNHSAKPHRRELTWDDLAGEIEGLAYAQGPIRASASALTERLGLGPRGAFIRNLISNGVSFPAELARVLGTRRSLITADLDRLKGAGLITAMSSAGDKRRKHLLLTAQGEGTVRAIRDAIAKTLRQNLGQYSLDEIKLFERMLRDARRGVGEPYPHLPTVRPKNAGQ